MSTSNCPGWSEAKSGGRIPARETGLRCAPSGYLLSFRAFGYVAVCRSIAVRSRKWSSAQCTLRTERARCRMWVSQTYLGCPDSGARVFVYYLWEEYKRQRDVPKVVLNRLTSLGRAFGKDVSLLHQFPARSTKFVQSSARRVTISFGTKLVRTPPVCYSLRNRLTISSHTPMSMSSSPCPAKSRGTMSLLSKYSSPSMRRARSDWKVMVKTVKVGR